MRKLITFNFKRKKSSFLKRRTKYGYLFVLPWILGFVFFFIQPFIQTMIYSFNNVVINNQKIVLTYVGFLNFQEAFFEDANFLRVLVSSISNVIVDSPMIVIFSLFAATLIHNKFPGRVVVRIIFFLPIIYGTGFLIQMQQQLTVGMGGTGYSIESTGLMKLFVEIAGIFPGINIIVGFVDRLFDIVTRSGVQILIFLAGLNSIPTMYYEASMIDGARSWDNFWLITFPIISPFILMNTVYTMVDSFTLSTNGMVTIIYDSINKLMFSYGSARSLVYFLSVFVIVIIVSKIISNKVVYTGGEF